MTDSSSTTLIRVYISSKVECCNFPFFLFELPTKESSCPFLDFLDQSFDVTRNEFSISSSSPVISLNGYDQDQLIESSLQNIFSNVKSSFELSLSVTDAFIDQDVISSGDTPKRIVNNSSVPLLLNSDNSLHIFDEIDTTLFPDFQGFKSIVVPHGFSFVLPSHSSVSVVSKSTKQYQSLFQSAFTNTVDLLTLSKTQQSVADICFSIQAGKDDLDYSANILQDFLPQPSKDLYTVPNSVQSRLRNVYFVLGSICRLESRASTLVPRLSLSDDDTEFDSLIKLLIASGIPYRESDPPSRLSDVRSFIYVDRHECLWVYKRDKNGYQVSNFDGDHSFRADGSSMPDGMIITIYPIASDPVTPWEFLCTGLQDAWLAIGMVIFTCTLLAAATLIPAFIIDQLTQTYIPYGDYSSLMFIGASSIALLFVIYIVQLLQARYLVRFEIISDANLQAMMVDRLLRIKPDSISIFTPGSLQSRVLGISQLRSIITSSLTPILTAYLSVVFNIVYLFLFSWQLSILVMIAGVILGGSTSIAAINRLKYFKQLTETDGLMLSAANDGINGISELRTFDTEQDYLRRFTNVIKPLISAIFNATRLRDRVDVLSSQTTYILYLFLLPLAYSLSTTSGSDTPVLDTGKAIAFLTCTQTFLTSFQKGIDKTISSFVQIATYWSRAFAVLQLPTESSNISKSLAQFDGSIDVSKLTYSYNPKESNLPPVINNFSFSIKPHSSTLFFGENGCGKSTLLSLLSYMHDDFSGTIFFSGHDLITLSPRLFRNSISNVPQNLLFIQGSLRSNITSGLSISNQQIETLLPTFFLDEFIKSLPMNLGTVVTPLAPAIPVLFKKKIFLLRSAIKKPKYLFVDDAFTGMDESEISSILLYFQKCGCTVLATSSDLDFKSCFDSVVDIH
jgi:ABC-type bacteriocin/lantibiotic exporter with double-glycine peptidase domain